MIRQAEQQKKQSEKLKREMRRSSFNFIIHPLRQCVSVALALSLLSSCGILFAPVLNSNSQGGNGSGSTQQCCCCCNSGGEMASSCCCASHHSGKGDRTTCSLSSAPCAAPMAILSPNVLDQWIDPGFGLNWTVVSAASEKFLSTTESLLSGTPNSLFHPPQFFFS